MSGLPHSFGVEQSLLGALIFDNREIDIVSDKLSSESFYAEQHQLVWRAISRMHSAGGIADPNTLLEFFERENQLKKIGGEEYLAQMVANAALEAEIPEYTDLLVDLQNRRDLIRMAQKVEASALKPDVNEKSGDIASKAQETIAEIMIGTTRKPAINVREGVRSYVKKIRDAKTADNMPFLTTGSKHLDKRLGGGFFCKDFIILGGRPSMGKTMECLSIIENAAKGPSVKMPDRKAHIAFFSLEMGDDDVIGRMMTSHTHKVAGKRYSSLKMRNYSIPEDDLATMEQYVDQIGENIHIEAEPGLSVRDIEVRALNLIRKIGFLDMIVIDYLQIIKPDPEDRKNGQQAAMTGISQALKNLAKKLHIPIVALSQLSRQVESRDDKRPQLSDLRDSGAIEQDADVVLFVYREHYYLERSEPEKTEKNKDKHIQWSVQVASAQNKIEIITAKQRLGPVGKDVLWCDTVTGFVGDEDPDGMYGTANRWND